METTQTKVRRPFHETIVDVIRGASTTEEFGCLAQIIKITKIPKGHDEIIAAWQKQMTDFMSGGEDFGVPVDLLEQRWEAEEEAKKKAAEKGQTVAITSPTS